MADNRDFVQGFMNEGGSPVYVEDKKLSEISTKTAIASEGVMLKGTDGAYYEIDKASLSEVIRAELGAILADNSKNNGTSVAKVPTLNSSGNALGASSVADLASVLGGAKVLDGNTSLNDYTTPGDYIGWSIYTDTPIGTYTGIVHLRVDTNASNSIVFQEYEDSEGMKYYRRKNSGTWFDWVRCDNFGCSTPSALASLLGVTNLGRIANNTNLNDINTIGFCVFDIGDDNTVQNGPGEGWTTILSIGGSNQFTQIAFGSSSIYMRHRDDVSNPWGEWVRK